jgi:hypothetical protein
MSRHLCGQLGWWISRTVHFGAHPLGDGGVLRTIGEAANYMLALPPARGERCQRWRQATKLILEQADVAAVSHQVHLALFYDAQLDIRAMR